jgi:hypothetical protein
MHRPNPFSILWLTNLVGRGPLCFCILLHIYRFLVGFTCPHCQGCREISDNVYPRVGDTLTLKSNPSLALLIMSVWPLQLAAPNFHPFTDSVLPLVLLPPRSPSVPPTFPMDRRLCGKKKIAAVNVAVATLYPLTSGTPQLLASWTTKCLGCPARWVLLWLLPK